MTGKDRDVKHRRVCLPIVACTALVVAACGSPSQQGGDGTAGLFKTSYDEIVAAAAEEEPVSVCATWDKEEFDVVYEEFQSRYPDVTVNYTSCQGIDTRQRLLNELRAEHVTYDALDVAAELLLTVVEADVLAKPDWSVFEDSPLTIDPRFIGKKFEERIAGVGSWSSVIAYNPGLVPRERVPKTYQECTEWNDEFMVDTRPQSFVVFYREWGPERLREWAKAIAANDPVWVRGATANLPSVATGEYPLFCGVQLHSTLRLLEANPNMALDYVIPEETNADILSKMAIAKGTDSPNAALLWVAFLVSNAGQEAIGEANAGYGSPFVETTEKAQMFDEAGATPVTVDWDLMEMSPKASEVIIEAWGFPQPQTGD